MNDQPAASNSPDWFARNWKWFIPLGVFISGAMMTVFVSGFIYCVFGMMRSSEPYQRAVAAAAQNPDVAASLGTPIKEGWYVLGNINYGGTSGNADLSIPISGPKGSGNIYVIANQVSGVWTYSSALVTVSTTHQQIIIHPALTPAN